MFKKVPHTYVIVFAIVILSAILTWIIPGGEYDRTVVNVNGTDRSVIVQDSYHQVENSGQSWEVFASFFKGFVDKADIIMFILIIGGAFWIMNASKSIDVGIYSFLEFTKKLEKNKFIRKIGVNNIILTLIMLIFSIFGATFGMSEETIAFTIIFVPMAIKMGYDSIVGVAICFVAAGLGFAGALLNPFTIGIAQGLSNLPLFSGIEYRFFCWFVINIIGFTFILRYAAKVRKNPEKSLVYTDDNYWRKHHDSDVENIEFYTPISAWISYIIILAAMIGFSFYYPQSTLKIGNAETTTYVLPIVTALFALLGFVSLRKSVHFFILNLLLFTIIFLIVGVMGYGWYIMEIATLFFAMGIFSGIAYNKSANDITKLFLEGVSDILSAALIVGLAGGILIVLEEGQIIDSILFYISKSMNDFGKIASVGMMYFIQNVINVIIPSGSAKAALTMPMMSQFSDLIGVSRQATVMAFQFGDGFTNMITPTSGVLIGVLGVAKIPYDKWVKWIGGFMAILILLGFLLLIPTVTMELNGF
ncbi:putative ion transporter superfamily protein YfcC [Ancylomarina subtilis]|uniref:Putative ion transporter superfamily protein YfcC n=1 Tax=Ancylomarina subtilis TaxID=1639035 RepID=A0A4Q7VKI9_9BACT|nr:AbgT family transporter [Ancylomarina subtilis]RZT96597.1 putative ion transporter superfamily protein YfcC [Ancylomarina subtilis]